MSQQTVSAEGFPQTIELIASFNAFFRSSFTVVLITVFTCLANGHAVVATHSWFTEQDPVKRI